MSHLIALWRWLIPRLSRDPGETRSQRIFRRIRIGIVIAACLVTLQSVLLVFSGVYRRPNEDAVNSAGAVVKWRR